MFSAFTNYASTVSLAPTLLGINYHGHRATFPNVMTAAQGVAAGVSGIELGIPLDYQTPYPLGHLSPFLFCA